MRSTTRQNVRARRSRVIDTLFYNDNMEVMLVENNSSSIERELENVMNGLASEEDSGLILIFL